MEDENEVGEGYAGRVEKPGSTEDNPQPGDEAQPSHKIPVTGVTGPYKS